MDEEPKRPKVGIGVLIQKNGKFLLGKRVSQHAPGVFSPPGGHLEYNETITEAGIRETREEAGIEIHNVRFLCVCNERAYGKHYLNVGLLADWKSGEPQIMEKDKFASWDWYELDQFPEPGFALNTLYIEAVKTGKNFFDN